MEKIFGNLVNDAKFAKIFLPMLIDTVKLTEGLSSDQTHQNIPHHFLLQQQFAKILPLQYFSVCVICVEANCNK